MFIELLHKAGLVTVQSWGLTLLGFVFLLAMLREALRLFQYGQADLVTPVLQCGAAGLVIQGLGPLGHALASLATDMAQGLFTSEHWSEAVLLGSSATEGPSFSGSYFSLNPLWFLHLITVNVLMLMVVAKVVIIDVLWRVIYGLVLLLGPLALPLAVVPGGSGVGTWLRSVIEIALWPVVFSALMALTAGVIASPGWETGLEAYDAYLSAEIHRPLRDLSFATVILLCELFTPYIAHIVVRTEAAGALGGMGMSAVQAAGSQVLGVVGGVAPSFAAGALSAAAGAMPASENDDTLGAARARLEGRA